VKLLTGVVLLLVIPMIEVRPAKVRPAEVRIGEIRKAEVRSHEVRQAELRPRDVRIPELRSAEVPSPPRSSAPSRVWVWRAYSWILVTCSSVGSTISLLCKVIVLSPPMRYFANLGRRSAAVQSRRA
jgi:hypothetical protein